MIKNIEQYPWKFLGAWTFPFILFKMPSFHSEYAWLRIIVYLLVCLTITFCFFSWNVKEAELDQAINKEIRKSAMTKGQLWHYTGCNVYDLTPNEREGYIFAMNNHEKKMLLKKLKDYNHSV